MSFFRIIGNIIWFICYGIWSFLVWGFIGVLLCITLIGIPFGVQCFKIGTFTLFPFGREIVHANFGTGSLILNILWILVFGWGLAVANLVAGILWCVTIVGIPFGLQCFKMAKISLIPFGAEITDIPNK